MTLQRENHSWEKKKINMGDHDCDTETLSDTVVIFSEDSLEPIQIEGKTDRQLLEVTCSKLSSITMELHQVNRKQDMIIKRIQKVENHVLNHDKEIQHLQKLHIQMDEKVNHLDEIVDSRFNPDVTVIAIKLPNYPSEDDSWLTKRLLSAVGCDDKCIV